jgi:hypothetical protein
MLKKKPVISNTANFLGTPASSTTKTGRHDIAEILLKVALNTKKKSINSNVSNLNNNDVLIYKINMKMKL